jgi:hypothetical protein
MGISRKDVLEVDCGRDRSAWTLDAAWAMSDDA